MIHVETNMDHLRQTDLPTYEDVTDTLTLVREPTTTTYTDYYVNFEDLSS